MFTAEALSKLSLGAIATGLPGGAGVLRRCGLPACDGPQTSLAEAAGAQGVFLPAVLGALEDLSAAEQPAADLPTPELIDHILERYHRCHRSELATLRHLATDLEASAAGQASAPVGLSVVIDALTLAVEEHMRKEELRVFPLMARGGGDRLPEWIALLRREHEDTAPYLLRFEAITSGFRLPATASGVWAHLYAELERLTDEMVAHVFLEEQVLFPRFFA